MELVIQPYLPAFEQRYAQALLPGHRQAINALLRCRTPMWPPGRFPCNAGSTLSP